jgi:hypothetical protein
MSRSVSVLIVSGPKNRDSLAQVAFKFGLQPLPDFRAARRYAC